MAKNMRMKGKEQHPIPIKKPISNKQRSVIYSTRQTQKSKKDATHTQVCSADLLLYFDRYFDRYLIDISSRMMTHEAWKRYFFSDEINGLLHVN